MDSDEMRAVRRVVGMLRDLAGDEGAMKLLEEVEDDLRARLATTIG